MQLKIICGTFRAYLSSALGLKTRPGQDLEQYKRCLENIKISKTNWSLK